MIDRTWKEIWAKRRIDESLGSELAQLMHADGLDTKFGAVSEESWRSFVRSSADQAGIVAGCTIFEVGCGAGAWIYDLYARGYAVAGLDRSPVLVDHARRVMPRGDWTCAEALDLDPSPPYDFVASCGVFTYFESLDYADAVLRKMIAKARRGILILDVPDLAKRTAAVAFRRGALGDEQYRERYSGLDHAYYDKEWFRRVLNEAGWPRIEIEDQNVEGYAHGAFRYNVIATRGATALL
jgi:SAM-dependent methyltransferase